MKGFIHMRKINRSSQEEQERWRGKHFSKRRKLVAHKGFTFTEHLLCASHYTRGQQTVA